MLKFRSLVFRVVRYYATGLVLKVVRFALARFEALQAFTDRKVVGFANVSVRVERVHLANAPYSS